MHARGYPLVGAWDASAAGAISDDRVHMEGEWTVSEVEVLAALVLGAAAPLWLR